MNRGYRYGCGLQFAMGSQQLLERSKGTAVEFMRDRVGAGQIRIDYSQQSNWRSFLLESLVDAGVIAAKGSHADDRDWNNGIFTQE